MSTKVLIAAAIAAAILVSIYFLAPQASVPTGPTDKGVVQVVGTPPAATSTQTNESTTSIKTFPESTQQHTTPAQTKVSTPAPAPPQLPYNALVVFDGGRFVPREVTIIKGGTVRFLNASDQNTKMWIATDNHPTHDRYPIKDDEKCSGNSFDECEAIKVGEYWDFTFDAEGTWGYHNDVDPKYTGSVKVMSAEDYLHQMPQD